MDMYIKMWAVLVMVGAGVAAFGQAVPMDGAQGAPAADFGAAPVSVMTGTIAEQNAAIEKALAAAGTARAGRVSQMNFSDIEFKTALTFISMQMKIDLRVDEEALASKGVVPGLVTLNLFDVSFPQLLEALRWTQRPTAGSVVWKVEDGVLRLVPVADAAVPAKETEVDVRGDAAQAAALKRPVAVDQVKEAVPVDMWVGLVSRASKVNILVDWKELEKAGLKKESVMLTLTEPTGEDVLKAVLATMKLKEGEVGYEIWGGLVRVSTKARLAAEKPAAAATRDAGLP